MSGILRVEGGKVPERREGSGMAMDGSSLKRIKEGLIGESFEPRTKDVR